MPPPTGTARSPRQERRYRRFKLRYPVQLQFRAGELVSEVDAITRDASIGGLLLECPVLIAEHTAVSFVIRLTGPTLHLIELAGDGEVVRVERGRTEGEFRVAVECKNPITPLNDYLPTASS